MVFAIFEKRLTDRPAVVQRKAHPDFTFVSTAAESDFALRRVGTQAGKLIETRGTQPGARGLSASSNYFIKARGIPSKDLRRRFASVDFHAAIKPAVGPASLSKGDIVAGYQQVIDQDSARRS